MKNDKTPPREPLKDVPAEIEVKWDDNTLSPGVKLKLDRSTYEACIANGILYSGMLKVPEDDRRRGVGTKLLSRLIEIAKEQGINEIWHTVQSVEGLLLITNKLKQPNRKYYLGGQREISFEEAEKVLKRKKEEGKQNDTSVMVNTTTYTNKLNE